MDVRHEGVAGVAYLLIYIQVGFRKDLSVQLWSDADLRIPNFTELSTFGLKYLISERYGHSYRKGEHGH